MVLASFSAAIFFALITPGPGVLTTAGIGANFGFQAGIRFVAGLFVGNNSVYLAVALGMFSVLEALPTLRMALAVVSLLYLLYLALKIALAGAQVAFIKPQQPPSFWGGVLLQFVNPKAYAVNAFFLSNFALLEQAPVTEVALKFVIINLFWIPIHFIWLGLGVGLQRLELPASLQRGINIAMALAMLLVVGLAAWVAQSA